MRQNRVQRLVEAALEALFLRDLILLHNNVAERTIAARLAVHLEPLFLDYEIDVEYNRHGLVPKAVDLPSNCRGGGQRLIVPDIIVHQRGNDDMNLLAIELKKQTNSESRECDRAKISAMKRELGYRFGCLIDLPTGGRASQENLVQEWL